MIEEIIKHPWDLTSGEGGDPGENEDGERGFEFTPELAALKIKELENRLDDIEQQIGLLIDEETRNSLLDELEAVRVKLGEIRPAIAVLSEVQADKKIQWLTLGIKVDGLMARAESLDRRIKSASLRGSVPPPPETPNPGGGGVEDGHGHEGHDYPHMGKYDNTKRFLLAPEIGGDWWDYEEVKDWEYGQIIQAIYLYIEMFLSRDWHLDRPFISQDLLGKHATIKPPGEDQMPFKLREAIVELGGDLTQVILDRIGALEGLTKRATDHQPLRILPHNSEEVVQAVAFSNSIIEGLFDTHTTGPEGELVELRARGMPVTNAVLLRFVFASMYNRGLNENSDERKKKPSPFEQEGGERLKYVKSFNQLTEAMIGLLKYVRSKLEGGDDFVEDLDMEYYLEGVPYSDNWAQENEVFVDDKVLERIVKAVVGKAINLGDSLLLRAIHDLNGSRHDELDISRLLRFRASQEKYYLYSSSGEFERRKGSVEVADIGNISFWESLFKPALQRVRMQPISVYIDVTAYEEALKEWDGNPDIEEPEKKDFFRVSSQEKQWHNVMTDWDIPSISFLNADQLEKVREILEKSEKIQDQMFLIQRGLDDGNQASLDAQTAVLSRQLIEILTEAGLLDQIPDKDESSPYNGGLVITSLLDLIKKHHLGSIEDEMKIINHVGPVRKALSDFDFDISSLVVKRNREISGDEAATFNPKLADSLSSVLRSAFYYWIQDYNKKELSAREYDEMTRNYAEPRREDFTDEEGSINIESYNTALAEWQEKWAWRGIPLRMYRRVSPEDSSPLLDKKTGKPSMIYVEYDINHLFNFHVDLNKLVKQKRMTKEEAAWHAQDFRRVIGAEDQLDEMMKVCTEKLVIMKIKSFIKAGGRWTGDHTYALVQLMSNEAFTKDREGFRKFIMRQKEGAFGIWPGVDETYAGSGGWTRDEVINLIKASVGTFKTFGLEIGKKDN